VPRGDVQPLIEEVASMEKNSLIAARVLLLVVLALSMSGCEVIGGIFKAGFWIGIIVVVLIVGIIGFIAAKLRG
jgi:hypothetical protein